MNNKEIKKIKGISYDFTIESNGNVFSIIPRLEDFGVLYFVEDLDNLFVAVQKAIELKHKEKAK